MGIIRSSYLLAYLEARLASKMRLDSREWARLTALRQWLARDPSHRQRAFRRFLIRAKGKVVVNGQSTTIELRELSAGGCRIATSTPFARGTTLKLSIELPDTTFIFHGTVVRDHQDNGETALAIAFSGIPLELRRFRRRPESASLPLSQASTNAV